MEFESLSEKLEWEARRVAVAFGLKRWSRDVWFVHSTATAFSGTQNDLEVAWRINPQGTAIHFAVGSGGANDCIVTLRGSDWKIAAEGLKREYTELMARGLFCLGFEEENVFVQLNHPLTAHEKLELRLSMPREFWPQKWLDAEMA